MTRPEDLPMFPVLDIDEPPERGEPIGSKVKFWFRREDRLWLFKKKRGVAGEDWAEKVAAELASLLGLPHAAVELARHSGTAGVVTRDFTGGHAHLVHGNELLFETDPGYPKEGYRKVHQHTLTAVRTVLGSRSVILPEWSWPTGVTTPWDGFLGYLLLDALIGNTDRHHQNWGVLVQPRAGHDTRELAPTFDHASSLGRELTDHEREIRLTTKDQRRNVRAYVARARSAFYDDAGNVLNTTEAFVQALASSPIAAQAWLSRLQSVRDEACAKVVARVPGPTMSDPSRRFALALLHETRTRLETLFD